MIKTNTLFILGAGASHPFGYPTGLRLRHQILKETHGTDIIKVFRTDKDDMIANLQKIEFDKFKEAFSRSGVYSIDSFLEHRPEFMDIGKMFIAKILISCEEDENLRKNIEENWYMYLFNRIKGSFEELAHNNISFITFNYDRSLEYFLFEAIKEQFSKGPDECVEMMKNFPIVHLYGQLDPLPWQAQEGKEYSSTENILDRLIAAPKNIKLISGEQDIEKSEYFQKAYRLIEDAERIFFLGFSFDETNLKRLHLNFIEDKKQILATVHKIEPTKLKWINKYFNQSAHTMDIVHEDVDTLTLLKNHLRIE